MSEPNPPSTNTVLKSTGCLFLMILAGAAVIYLCVGILAGI